MNPGIGDIFGGGGGISLGGTLGDLGNQLKDIAKDPAGYLTDVGEKIKNLPEDFQKAKDNITKNLSAITLGKLLTRLGIIMEKEIKPTMNNEQKLQQMVSGVVAEFKADPEGTAEGCPTLVRDFLMLQIGMMLVQAPDSEMFIYFKDNVTRVSQEECSKAYA